MCIRTKRTTEEAKIHCQIGNFTNLFFNVITIVALIAINVDMARYMGVVY